MKLRYIPILVGLLLIATTALAAPPESGVRPDAESGSVAVSGGGCTDYSASDLPKDFDYSTGYAIEEIGENHYVAYIAAPMDPEAEATKVAYPFGEGWSWWDDPLFNGSCTCVYNHPRYGSPELRTNHVEVHNQRIFFRWKVPAAALGYEVLNATLCMHCCDTREGLPLDVECWDAEFSNIPGPGADYAQSCHEPLRPFCNVNGAQIAYRLLAWQSTTTVTLMGLWYCWDVTGAVQRWFDSAPCDGDLMLFGVSGDGRFKRFSSACNYQHPGEKPYLKVEFTK